MNSSASAIMDVQQFSLSLRAPVQRRPFSSGLLERRARRLQRLWQRRAVENRQRSFRSTFLLLTLLTTQHVTVSFSNALHNLQRNRIHPTSVYTRIFGRTVPKRTAPDLLLRAYSLRSVRYGAIKRCLHTSLLPYRGVPWRTSTVWPRSVNTVLDSVWPVSGVKVEAICLDSW